jgi:hypothetical protein
VNATTLRSQYGREPVSAYIGEGWNLLPLAVGGVPFHRVGRYAITVGAPLGPHADAAEATTAFRQHCRSKGWRPVVFQASSPVDGLRSHLIAREAFIDVPDFSLSGSAMANARHSVSRARRDGTTVRWQRWSECDSETRAQMNLISEAWRGRRPELSFTYGRLRDIPNDAWVGVAIANGGRVEAFSTWRPLPAGPGMVLDLIRRRKDSTPGVVELLVVEAVELARSQGMDWLSLGSVTEGRDLPRWLRLVLASAAACGGSGLTSFKAKFRPRWEDRYLALPSRTAGLAGVLALAIAHVRGARMRPERATTIRLKRPVARWATAAGMTAALSAFGVGAAATDIGWPTTGPIQLALSSATDKIQPVPTPSEAALNPGVNPAPVVVSTPVNSVAASLPEVVTASESGGTADANTAKSDAPDLVRSVPILPSTATCAATAVSHAATPNPGTRCGTAVKQTPPVPRPTAGPTGQASASPTHQPTPSPTPTKPSSGGSGHQGDRPVVSQSPHKTTANGLNP